VAVLVVGQQHVALRAARRREKYLGGDAGECLGLVGLDLPTWAQWSAFAVLAVATMFTVRRQIYLKLMNKPMGNVSTDVDQRIVLKQELAPGKSCRIEYRGSGWTAINVGERAIAAGDFARIDSIAGVTLNVRAI